MAYELWDAETGNLQGTYETEEAALDVVCRALREHGEDYVRTLLLGSEDHRGQSRLIASSEALVDRARRRGTARASA